MTNSDFHSIKEMKDPVSHFVYDLLRSYKIPKTLAFSFIKYGARDHARVPMAWDDSENGGFNSGHEPWQCLNTSFRKINVKNDLSSGKSVYRYYQKLLALRKSREIFIFGEVEEYDHDHKAIIAYSRQYEGKRIFTAGNFSKKPVSYLLPSWCYDGEILLSNYEVLQQDGLRVLLEPYQAIVLEEKAG